MWIRLTVCFCLQILVCTATESKKKSDDMFFKIKGKSSSVKKAKPESLLATTSPSIGISLPEEYANDTIKEDHHKYYNSTFYGESSLAKSLWVDLDKMKKEHVITSAMLSDSHRQATAVNLSFEFPFYGSDIQKITIATGGFLYMGEYMHNWIAATQYIAPLMANFDTKMSENSTVKYADNGTAFVVQWDNVYIQDKKDDGAFTFQVTLYNNGDICFAYKAIPCSIGEISDDIHPVKVGISDAYILERAVFFIRRKTIYEYHRVDMKKYEITNNTAIYLRALSTCLNYKTCDTCIEADPKLECNWCDAIERCSDGIDRRRQDWIVHGCPLQVHSTCPINGSEGSFSKPGKALPASTDSSHSVYTSPRTAKTSDMPMDKNNHLQYEYGYENKSHYGKQPFEVSHYTQEEQLDLNHPITTGAIVSIIVFISILIAVGVWIFYAYRFPQTPSGQFLIKYRPSQWSIKTEDRGTNAGSFNM